MKERESEVFIRFKIYGRGLKIYLTLKELGVNSIEEWNAKPEQEQKDAIMKAVNFGMEFKSVNYIPGYDVAKKLDAGMLLTRREWLGDEIIGKFNGVVVHQDGGGNVRTVERWKVKDIFAVHNDYYEAERDDRDIS